MKRKINKKVFLYFVELIVGVYFIGSAFFWENDPLSKFVLGVLEGRRLFSGYVNYKNKLKVFAPKGSVVEWKDGGEKLRINFGKKIVTSHSITISKANTKEKKEKWKKSAAFKKETIEINGKKVFVVEPLPPKRGEAFVIFCYPEGMNIEIFCCGFSQNRDVFYYLLKKLVWIE